GRSRTRHRFPAHVVASARRRGRDPPTVGRCESIVEREAVVAIGVLHHGRADDFSGKPAPPTKPPPAQRYLSDVPGHVPGDEVPEYRQPKQQSDGGGALAGYSRARRIRLQVADGDPAILLEGTVRGLVDRGLSVVGFVIACVEAVRVRDVM